MEKTEETFKRAKPGELKPCPFCGEAKELYFERYATEAGPRWLVTCARCMATICRGYDQTPGHLVEAWNKREGVNTHE